MYSCEHTETAARYRRNANRERARSRADAQRAAAFYRTAARARNHARWVTERPDLCWGTGSTGTPAEIENDARTWTRIADTHLRSSFRRMDTVRHYNALARGYDKLAA